jgi:hypothetical protein
MAKKHTTRDERDKNELWIAPRYSRKEAIGEPLNENRPGELPTSNRFLELADIALGLKKPAKKKKAAAAGAGAHHTSKKEPYPR